MSAVIWFYDNNNQIKTHLVCKPVFTGFFAPEKNKFIMKNEIDIPELIKRLKQFAVERDWEQFHAPKNLASSISIEAAELLEHFQWLTNEQSEQLADEKKQQVAYEMADVFIFL